MSAEVPLQPSGWTWCYTDQTDDEDLDWINLRAPILDAEDAATDACAADYHNHDGWERGTDEEFKIRVRAPSGAETDFTCYHEITVLHRTVVHRSTDRNT